MKLKSDVQNKKDTIIIIKLAFSLEGEAEASKSNGFQ